MEVAGTSKLIDGYNPQNKSHDRLGHGSFSFSYLWANRPYTHRSPLNELSPTPLVAKLPSLLHGPVAEDGEAEMGIENSVCQIRSNPR